MARRQREAGAPENTFITVTDLTQPSASAPVATSRTKMTGIAAGMGLIVTLTVTVMLDALRRRRKVRRVAGGGAPVAAVQRLTDSPVAGEPVGAGSASH
jgi:hypothetical protein